VVVLGWQPLAVLEGLVIGLMGGVLLREMVTRAMEALASCLTLLLPKPPQCLQEVSSVNRLMVGMRQTVDASMSR